MVGRRSMSKCALCKTSLKDDEINVCDKCRLDFLNFKQQLSEKDKEIERLKKNMEFDTAYYVKELVNVRKQVCEEIYNFIMSNWEDIMGRQGRYQNFSGTCLDLKEDLQQIAENGYEKENKR